MANSTHPTHPNRATASVVDRTRRPDSVGNGRVSGSPLLVAERLSDRLALLLTSQISAGNLQPGDRLPTE